MLVATVALATLSLFQPPDSTHVGGTSRATLAAVAVEAGTVRLDGRLDEAAWATATAATGFVQRDPAPGEPATESTEARVLYDGSALYVGMRMHDREAARIDARLGRRDANLSTDWAIVAFDSYGEGRTGFVFSVSAGGVQRDQLLFDDVRDDDSWDAVWDAAVERDGDGWTAEFRIPLSQLRFSSGDDDTAEGATWGVQFGRTIGRRNEESFWSPFLPADDGIVSRFGQLTGLRGLRAPRQLELVPYVAAGVTRAPGDLADPFYAATDATPRAGLDLKYGLTGDLTLTATVNPDFGQVEADPAQVNLGAFELFFEERRPFFVEGADIFSFGRTRSFINENRPEFLYTRRIGRAPHRGDFVPDAAEAAAGADGTVYTSAPGQTPILGAAKLSGRIGRFSIGALSAVTGRQLGRFQAFDATGTRVMDGTAVVEPTTHYGVARARATFGPSTLGVAGTAVHREHADDALAALLPRQALVGQLDGEHRLGNDWILSGVLAGSHVSGTTDAIARLQNAFPRLYGRPDAGHLAVDSSRTALAGYTGELALTKAAGRHWLGSVSTAVTSPGFDTNGLGYQSRADVGGLYGVLVYQQNDPVGAWLRYSGNVFAGIGWNFAGDRTQSFVGGNVSGRLRSFWSGNINWGAWPRTVDDRLTRGGPLALSPAGARININGSSDYRKPVAGYFWTGANANELGSWYHGIEVGAELRPSSSVQISIGPGVEWSHTARQFLERRDAPALAATFGERYVFGVLDQTSASMTVRADWTFSPTLSLQLVARPFIAAGRYPAFGELAAAGDLDLFQYGRDGGSATRGADGTVTIAPADGSAPFTLEPDFTVRALQGNAVLRWEYRPGSALFVVWQQSREGFDNAGDFRFGRDARGLFTDTPTNVFLVKLSYWLG